MTITCENTIDYPSAESLDTAHFGEASGRELQIWLVPSLEGDTGRPSFDMHEQIGAHSVPMPGHHGRWICIAAIRQAVTGASLLAALMAIESDLLTLDAEYLGSEWDGSNQIGRWSEDARDFEQDIAIDTDRLISYYDAAEYYQDDTWIDLARIAEVAPERALAKDWRSVVPVVAAALVRDADDVLSNAEQCAEDAIERYRDSIESADADGAE